MRRTQPMAEQNRLCCLLCYRWGHWVLYVLPWWLLWMHRRWDGDRACGKGPSPFRIHAVAGRCCVVGMEKTAAAAAAAAAAATLSLFRIDDAYKERDYLRTNAVATISWHHFLRRTVTLLPWSSAGGGRLFQILNDHVFLVILGKKYLSKLAFSDPLLDLNSCARDYGRFERRFGLLCC